MTPLPLEDRSGTITSGGTAQTIAAACFSRSYFFLQNISDTTLWVNFGTTAVADQPSIQLTAGASLVYEGSVVPNQAVSVIGASTGKKFVCKEA